MLSELQNSVIETDVCIIGAGVSGVPAAIAAARNGAKVVLVEEDMLCGGGPVDNFLVMPCGGPITGIYREMLTMLNAGFDLKNEPLPGEKPCFEDGKNHFWQPSSYARVIGQMLRAEDGITVLNGCLCTGAKTKDGRNGKRVTEAILHNGANRKIHVGAKAFVDTTGTAAFAALCGSALRYGQETKSESGERLAPESVQDVENNVMPCTWMYIAERTYGTELPPLSEFREYNREPGFVENKLHNWATALPEEYIKRNTGQYIVWGTTLVCPDTYDLSQLGQTQQKAQELIEYNLQVWNRYGFSVHLAPKMGVRETARIVGEETITLEYLEKGEQPKDTIAYIQSGVDLWQSSFDDNDAALKTAGVPYRALIPKNLDGLLVAGKSISCTRIAMSAYRMQPIVAAVGQAAGTAAALCAADGVGVREVDIPALKSILKKDCVKGDF